MKSRANCGGDDDGRCDAGMGVSLGGVVEARKRDGKEDGKREEGK